MEEIKRNLESVVRALTGEGNWGNSLSGIDVSEQFHPKGDDPYAISRNLNAAFLLASAGESHHLCIKARHYLDNFLGHPSWKGLVSFYLSGLELMPAEVAQRCSSDVQFRKALDHLASWIEKPEGRTDNRQRIMNIYRVLFPEGDSLFDRDERIKRVRSLRNKRTVTVSRMNTSPITDPGGEVLFTSNILVTIPSATEDIRGLPLSSGLQESLRQIVHEEQMYWYDHPIPLGVAPEQNEILHGLEGLDNAVAFEKQRGNMGRDKRLNCILSVSVTHEGLQRVVREYLQEELSREKNIRHLNVFVITEEDAISIIQEIIVPAAEKFVGIQEQGSLFEVIGVDGEYGRHFSFLKAIAAFWKVLIDSEVMGTFKIDLDQVFPQKELVEQSGSSAFEHLRTPLWGAEGVDSDGHRVELGMIAGALVNEKDIGHSLFYPDVPFPEREIQGDEVIFNSLLPQALSTEAEMMTRYSKDGFDGRNHCLQRIHVTGGTCGILIESLRKYRPFTPTFIGRAEDQAYILSVLFDKSDKHLRYAHKDGLIMRHDKEAFAAEAIKAASTGKLIGDYVRILMFSHYVRALPWSFQAVKDIIDPFTGCFVSRIPLTVVYLRFAMKAASFFQKKTEESNQLGFEFLKLGFRRLHRIIQEIMQEPNPLIAQFENEQKGWNIFYDVLDGLEKHLHNGDPFALELRDRARSLIRACRINFKTA